MSYSDVIEQAAESEIKSAFAVLVKAIADEESAAPARFSRALATIEQARVAALAFTQQGGLAR